MPSKNMPTSYFYYTVYEKQYVSQVVCPNSKHSRVGEKYPDSEMYIRLYIL